MRRNYTPKKFTTKLVQSVIDARVVRVNLGGRLSVSDRYDLGIYKSSVWSDWLKGKKNGR